MTLWRATRNILLALPEELINKIDESAKQMFMSRSAYIRYALHQEINRQKTFEDQLKTEEFNPKWLDLDDS